MLNLFVENSVVSVIWFPEIGRYGVVGHHVVLLVERAQKQEQEPVITHHLKTEDCHVLALWWNTSPVI